MIRLSAILAVLVWLSGPVEAGGPERIWIDSDAACTGAPHKDPDDCLAVWALARDGAVDIAGLSSAFGNVGVSEADATLADLAARIGGLPPVLAGAAGPLRHRKSAAPTDAANGMCEALADGPLTIVALAPLTNVSEAFATCPERIPNVTRIVFVGGRRAGHVFHPSEDAMPKARFRHGPIFRDLNVERDPDAARAVLASPVPVTLVPYELARQVELTGSDLDLFAAQDAAAARIAASSRPWLAYWHRDIGRNGFYPFDLVAAAVLLRPETIGCRDLPVALMRDRKIDLFLGPQSLLLDPPDRHPARPVTACLVLRPGGDEAVRGLLAPRAPEAGGA